MLKDIRTHPGLTRGLGEPKSVLKIKHQLNRISTSFPVEKTGTRFAHQCKQLENSQNMN